MTFLIDIVAGKLIDVLIEKVGKSFSNTLRSPIKIELDHAIGRAIQLYTAGTTRTILIQPLLDPNGILNQEEFLEEIACIAKPECEPNIKKMGQIWQKLSASDQDWRNFEDEAQKLVNCIKEELGKTEIFWPSIQGKNITTITSNIITITSEVSNLRKSIYSIENQIISLNDLITSPQFIKLITQFSKPDFPNELKENIPDFSNYIATKTQNFVGRDFLFDEIKSFTNQNSSGYLFIRGDPGIGKSALAAQLVKTNGYIHHFNIGPQGYNTAQFFLKNVCSQLIAKYQLEKTLLSTVTENNVNSEFLIELLKAVSKKLSSKDSVDKCIIIVDALDEVTDEDRTTTCDNKLCLPSEKLPENIFFVITTRRKPHGLYLLAPQKNFDIIQDDPNNVIDIRRFLQRSLKRLGIKNYVADNNISKDIFLKEMEAKSQGNFMYLYHVLPEIEIGRYSDFSLSEIPDGLSNYYSHHWEYMRSRDEAVWFDYQLPVIVAITIAPGLIPFKLLSEFSGIKKPSLVRSILNDWEQFIYRSLTNKREQGYRLYHETFREFVIEKAELEDEHINLNKIYGQMIKQLKGKMGDLPNGW